MKNLTEEQIGQIKTLERAFQKKVLIGVVKLTGIVLATSAIITVINQLYVHNIAFGIVSSLVSGILVGRSYAPKLQGQMKELESEVKKIVG